MTGPCSRRRYVRAVGVATLAPGLAGCSVDGGGGGGTTVDMTDALRYDPERVDVRVGERVTWENVGSASHTVTAYGDSVPAGAEYFASGGFDSERAARDGWAPGDRDSGDVPGGGSYSHAFETAGTYEYFCIPHESAGMVGTVAVEEG